MLLLHNLPSQSARFIGREREIAEISRLLAQERLLTLTGAGGSGKTSLAIQVAIAFSRTTHGTFPDGIWLVQLAPLSDSTLIPRTVARVLGVRGTVRQPLLTTLAAALAPRRLLLILDNCEHLIGACARLAETLLSACPRLHILATSREPLRIPGERIWRVPSLALPEPASAASPEVIAGAEAVKLFIDRARLRQPAFTLTTENAPIVATICRQLDGLPLGIELAAAQLGTLAAEQIADRLQGSLRLLGGGSRTIPRQETMRAALDWSYALLDEPERLLFRRLAVFSASFGLDAAEAVCGGDGLARENVLPLLVALVEKSLVEARIDSEARYRLLEPVRQYASEYLTTADEMTVTRRRHAHYFCDLAELAEPKLWSRGREEWMRRLSADGDNLRAALTWSRQGDPEIELRLAASLIWFWNFRGEVSAGLDWIEDALKRTRDAPAAARARALYGSAEFAWVAGQISMSQERIDDSIELWRTLAESGNHEHKRGLAYALQSLPMTVDRAGARESAAESLKLFEEIGDAWGAAMAFGAMGFAEYGRDDAAAEAMFATGLSHSREVGDEWSVAQMLNILGDLARGRGDEATARRRYEESLILLQKQGMTGTVPSILHNLGYLALRGGDTRRALKLFRESLTMFQHQGDQRGAAECFAGLAGVLAAMKHPVKAANLLGASEGLLAEMGSTVWPANVPDYERSIEAIRRQLSEADFATARAAGKAMRMEEAVAIMATTGMKDEASAGSELTPREREVAALVAQGFTNRQIGSALFITEDTARLHVKHILRTLGFNSRTQIASWAVANGLAAAPEAT